MKRPLWFLLVSDLHIGSALSLWPANIRLSTGNPITLNSGQRYLAKNWGIIEDRIKDKTGGKLDGLVVDGDMIHGPANDKVGETNVETSLAHQGLGALEILTPLREMADACWVLQGTKWHVGTFADSEEWVAHSMDAVQTPDGMYCWRWIPSLNVEGFIMDIAHTQSYTMVNRTMPLERELRHAALIQDMKPMPHLIVRAHAHISTFVEADGYCALGLPPMQLQTPYAQKSRTPSRMMSRWLGVVLIEIFPGLVGTNERPFNYHWLRFRHPAPFSSKHVPPKRSKGWTTRIQDQILRWKIF